MLSKKLLSVLVILFGVTVSFGAYAQKIAVRGTVSDANGPVIGAVVLSGSTGVTTDADGSFSIRMDPSPSASTPTLSSKSPASAI